MSRKLLSTEKRTTRKEAAEKIHSLADKISEGRVDLKAGNDSVNLEPTHQVEFELDVEEEQDGDISLEIEVEWSETETSEELEIQ